MEGGWGHSAQQVLHIVQDCLKVTYIHHIHALCVRLAEHYDPTPLPRMLTPLAKSPRNPGVGQEGPTQLGKKGKTHVLRTLPTAVDGMTGTKVPRPDETAARMGYDQQEWSSDC